VKRVALLLFAIGLVVTGCDRLLTVAPLGFLQRDPENLSEEQLEAFARDAIRAGDVAAMQSAYDLLKDSDDAPSQLLAVDLALAITDTARSLAGLISGLNADPDNPESVMNDVYDSYDAEDLSLLIEAAALLDDAEEDVSPSAEQYAFSSFGLIGCAADDADGVENLNPPPGGSDAETYVTQALLFLDDAATILTEAERSTSLLEGFGGAIGWTPE
jgi:hypothetical protein